MSMRDMGVMTDPGAPPSQPGSGGAGWLGPAAALIGVGAGLYDSHQDRKAAERNQKRSIAGSKAEAELAYQRQLEMWHMMNAYNSPQAQMERYGLAGLNPHMIYGSGGSGGNASSMPSYQPISPKYDIPPVHVAPALQSILPTLMSVGTWMQNMRLSEVELMKKQTETDKIDLVMSYLRDANPKLLRAMDQKYDLGEYQHQIQFYRGQQAASQLAMMDSEFRHRFGEDLFKAYHGGEDNRTKNQIGGIRRLEFLQKEAEMRLKQAQASWTDFNITSPQALIQMVMGSVMGMAGQTLKFTRGQSFNARTRSRSSESSFNETTKRFSDFAKRRY